MKYWIFYISDDPSKLKLSSGWARAKTAAAVLNLVDHEDAHVVEVPDDLGFPREATVPIYWERSA